MYMKNAERLAFPAATERKLGNGKPPKLRTNSKKRAEP
jgi:hypothetical protein